MISLEDKWEIDNEIGFEIIKKNGDKVLIKNGKIEEVKDDIKEKTETD